MTRDVQKISRLESLLAALLHYGTWLATSVIGLGLALVVIESRWSLQNAESPAAMRIVTLGIALFILLPVARVVLMLTVFIRDRDYRFTAIAATVLMIILSAFALGLHTPKPPEPGAMPSPQSVH